MSPIHRICDALGVRSVVRAGMARVSTVPSIASSMTARVRMPRAAQERPVAAWVLRDVVMPTHLTDQMVGNKVAMCRLGDWCGSRCPGGRPASGASPCGNRMDPV